MSKGRWGMEDLQKLRPGMVVPAAAVQVPKPAPVKKEPQALLEMKAWLRILGIEFVTEHRFHPVRKWRFDIAILAHQIAIEYEGVISEKSRHTTLTGYTQDASKYNEAQKMGWRVLRYTALNQGDFMKDIAELIKPNK